MPHKPRPEVGAFLPVKPLIFHILLALREGERHGYGIVKALEQRPGAELRIEPGNLYRALRTMLVQGLIEESHRRPDPALDDERRRYFRLTDLGLAVAKAEAARLERLVVLAKSRQLLAGPDRGR